MATTDSLAAATSTDSQTTSTSKAVQSKATLAKDLNHFLTLLTTQLKHQDPLSPMDSTQFTNQLVQFASVEQQINANANLEELITLQEGSQMLSALSYLDKTVEAKTSSLPLQGGAASFTYDLPESAKTTVIAILDSAGIPVYSTGGEITAGEHTLSWDGKDSTGKQLADGTYKVMVTAIGADDIAMDVTTYAQGKVTGVGTESGVISLQLGGVSVPLSDVKSVVAAKAN